MAISEVAILLYSLVILTDVTKSDIFHHKINVTFLWKSPLSASYRNPLPKENITLDCSEFGEEAVIQILNVYYIRQPWIGDEECLSGRTLKSCCGAFWYTEENRNCVVSIPESVYDNTVKKCNGNSTCVDEIQAVDLNGYCNNRCSTADTKAWQNTCLSRLVEVRYICIQRTKGMFSIIW